MLKRTDYIIISIICFFLGIFLVAQFYSGREYKHVSQPENNEVIALEVAKLTKSNADLRREVFDLTSDLNIYKNANDQQRSSAEKYKADEERLARIIGALPVSGQGAVIQINGPLGMPQIVDLVNAIKNIGTEVIAINDERLMLNTDFNRFRGLSRLEIKIYGNSKLLKSAMERRGGIIEQISIKNISINVTESEKVEIGSGNVAEFRYARIAGD